MQRILTPHESLDLANQIASLARFHSQRLSDEKIAHWQKTLAPYYGPTLEAVISAAKNEKSMPSLGSILEALSSMNARSTKAAPLTRQPLTMEERERSELSRKKSGLWLYYAKHAPLSTLAVFGLGTLEKLESAKAEYDERTIRAWFDMQERLELQNAMQTAEPRGSWQDL